MFPYPKPRAIPATSAPLHATTSATTSSIVGASRHRNALFRRPS
jgi:hypothetical protein